jgi:endo-1,4-beta-xylanase
MSDPRTRPRIKRAAILLATAVTAAVAAGVALVVISTPSYANAPLRTHAQQRGKFIGFAANTSLLCNNSATCTSGSDATYRNLAITEFNQVTPENAMKWDATEPNDNQYNFTAADGVVAFAAANNEVVHGHTLVWHSQTPGWVQGLSATAMRTAMTDHINTVVGRYANSPVVQSWDVVNEAFNEDGTRRASFWQNTLGNGYIAEAFQLARAADPNARLCYNDFNIDGMGAKSNAVFALVQGFKQQGIPIDCVGFQGHLAVQFSFPSQVQQNIQRFVNLGVTVRITELDVRRITAGSATEIQQRETLQNQYITNYFNACLAVTGCEGITMWGIDDGHSWIPSTFTDQCCGLLWTSSYQQKAMYTAAHNALAAGTTTPPPDTTAPSAPTNLMSPSQTSSSINLSWTASTDNVGVTGYDILRAPGTTGGTFAVIGTSTTTTFSNTGLTAATTFRYQVRARDAANNMSAVSNTVTASTQPATGDTTPPSAPGTLSAAGTTQTSTNLTWGAATDNVGVTGYDILRAPGASGGTFAVVATSTTTSATATGLTANTTYRFQVRARDAAGNIGPVSNTVQITTLPSTGGGGCSVNAVLQTQWPDGYVFQPVNVTNTGTATITSWTVTFTLPAGHTITNSWNATLTINGQNITARNVSYNGTLAPNGTTNFGFQVSRPSGNTALASGFTCTTP